MVEERKSNRIKTILNRSIPYIIATVICLLILVVLYRFWRVNFTVPFNYNGDSLTVGVGIKGIVENGWYLHNPSVGMPTGLFLNDYPNADFMYWAMIRILAVFTSNWALIFNLFILIAYPLVTLTSLYVFKHLKFSTTTAIVASLLYTYLPFHWWRATGHVFLAIYFVVPLVVLVAIWLSTGEVTFFTLRKRRDKETSTSNKPRAIAACVILVLIGCSGLYYAFFAAFFLALAGIISYSKRKDITALWTTGVMLLIVVSVIVLNISPFIAYRVQNGANPEAVVRGYTGSEVYALKITQLLLPVPGHWVPYLAQVRADYDRVAPLVNENSTASLGFIGSLGFLFLLGWLFFAHGKDVKWLPFSVNDISLFNIGAVLLGTIGGLGMVLTLGLAGMGLPPPLRAWNRISVYIAFFSFIAVAVCLDYIRKNLKKRHLVALFYVIAVFVLVFAMFDQIQRGGRDNQFVIAEYQMDNVFVSRIEKTLPARSMIFQLPYMQFPENGPLNKMMDYDLFRGYLHSKNLRWSYGAVNGREGSFWQKKVSRLQTPDMVKEISAKGFRGIYIERLGYEDNGQNIEQQLQGILHTQPLVNGDKTIAFYKIP
jgi:hypothetical protein